uniref:Uncharacterized protein n=1 Tax=Ciona savignyi TaxID=51511 RepID=H2Z6U6_CIOSA
MFFLIVCILKHNVAIGREAKYVLIKMNRNNIWMVKIICHRLNYHVFGCYFVTTFWNLINLLMKIVQSTLLVFLIIYAMFFPNIFQQMTVIKYFTF